MIGRMIRLAWCAMTWLVAASCLAQEVPPMGKSGGIALPDPPRIPLPWEIPPFEPAFFADLTPGLAIDTASREAVRMFYKGAYSLSDNVAINWTGMHASCTAGITDQLYQNAVALRINWFRALAGVPAAVNLYGPYSAQDQQAALVMSANNSLSHTPPSNWHCWTQTAYDAAGKSNLSLGAYGPDAVVGYMRDSGSNNSAVGHRRWLLYPQTQNMGSGDVPAGTFNGGNVYGANALWVIDSNYGGTRPAVRDGFIAWPPKGYVPYPVVFGRWSFSYPNADFTNATVTVTRNGVSIPISKETLANPAYGENTLVWLLQGTNDGTAWPKPAADETYAITIGNVLIGGSSQSFAYHVIVFDPDVPTSGAPRTTVTPPASVVTGNSFSANIAPMTDATAYQVALYRLADLPGVLLPGAAPSPWSYVTGPQNAYNPIEATSYHLYHSDFSEQSLTLGKKLYIGSNASLSFLSWFTYATAGQIARVQISLDDGISWQDIHTETGSNQTVQTTRNVPLSAFAGRFARLRFVFSYVLGMSAYYSPPTGWYFKNVSLVNVRDMLDEQMATVPSTQNTAGFTVNTPASHVMAARTQYQGLYFTDWGPASVFQVTTVTGAIGTSGKLATAPRPSSPGQSVQVSITITPASNVGTLSGTIAVSGGGKSCTITLPATSCNLTFDTRGLITLTATYSGNAFYAGSATTLRHRVGKVNIVPILMMLLE